MSLAFLCGIAWTATAWTQNEANVRLVGVAGTVAQPMYERWFREYRKVRPGVDFRCLPLGTAQAIQAVTSGEADYGSSDAPMSEKELAGASVKVIHLLALVSAVVPIYNIPGVNATLRLTPQALAGIYLGNITAWNDPAISSVNPGIQLPATHIVVFHSGNGRGTTYTWSDYLSKVSPEWKARVGKGTTIEWPVGLTAEGSGNTARMVKETPNALGYVDLSFALASNLRYASVRNASGNFVIPSRESAAAAAATARSMRGDFRVSLTNTPGEKVYPITSFTWILVPERIGDSEKRKAMVQFLRWMLTDGQRFPELLNYTPLPQETVVRELEVLDRISGR